MECEVWGPMACVRGIQMISCCIVIFIIHMYTMYGIIIIADIGCEVWSVWCAV